MKRFASCAILLGLCVAVAAWTPDVPGQVFHISRDLPAPNPAPDPDKPPPEDLSWPQGRTPQVPKGFSISVFARLSDPSWIAVAPNGDVLLSQAGTKKVLLLRDTDGAGRANQITTFSEGYQAPHGLALRGGWLYVADFRTVWRVPYVDGATVAGVKPELVTSAGPADDKAMTRALAFDSKGDLYWGFAGPRKGTENSPPDATIQQIAPNGSITTFAAGLATVTGLAFYPGTDRLFAAVDERRGLGPGLVPDFLTQVEKDGFYGWPYAYIGNHPDPRWGAERPDMVAKAKQPDLLFEAGSTPLSLAFYTGRQFPASYRGDAFVVLHGSWKQGAPTGYKIVRVPFRNGVPVGTYQNFVTGFMQAGPDNQPQMLGRPAVVAVAKDGSLLISDNVGGTVWRVTYTGK